MSNAKSMNSTFKKMRELPLEVSLDQVKLWVQEAPPIQLKKTKWSFFGWLRSSISDN